MIRLLMTLLLAATATGIGFLAVWDLLNGLPYSFVLFSIICAGLLWLNKGYHDYVTQGSYDIEPKTKWPRASVYWQSMHVLKSNDGAHAMKHACPICAHSEYISTTKPLGRSNNNFTCTWCRVESVVLSWEDDG
jgi:hypothetical protein